MNTVESRGSRWYCLVWLVPIAVGGVLVYCQLHTTPWFVTLGAGMRFTRGWPMAYVLLQERGSPPALKIREVYLARLVINVSISLAVSACTAYLFGKWARRRLQVPLATILMLPAVMAMLFAMNHFDPWLIRPVSEPWYVQAVVIFGVGCTLYVAWRLVGRAVVWASHSGFALLTVGRSLEPPLNSSGGSIADKEKKLHIREARESDLNDVLSVEREAFGHTKEAELVRELLEDPSAQPVLSLLALEDDRAVGHILFTAVHLENTEDTASMAILAPLAIVPAAQKQGIGGKLIQEGLQLLAKSGVDIVLVLGHPEYYPRYGFRPAERLGFEAPYPIPEEHADAWMVQELRPNRIGSIRGKVVCADTLSKPEHWRE